MSFTQSDSLFGRALYLEGCHLFNSTDNINTSHPQADLVVMSCQEFEITFKQLHALYHNNWVSLSVD